MINSLNLIVFVVCTQLKKYLARIFSFVWRKWRKKIIHWILTISRSRSIYRKNNIATKFIDLIIRSFEICSVLSAIGLFSLLKTWSAEALQTFWESVSDYRLNWLGLCNGKFALTVTSKILDNTHLLHHICAAGSVRSLRQDVKAKLESSIDKNISTRSGEMYGKFVLLKMGFFITLVWFWN